jgi:aspartate/methionine/tyrosine aminotransferase
MTIRELLALGTPGDREAFLDLGLGYTDTWGEAPLREAVAATHERVAPADVLCFAGAEEGLFWALQALAGPGDHVLATVPNYQSMETLLRATGAEVEGIPLDPDRGWALDLDRLTDAFRPETRLVAVNFPNNPTGALPEPETFRELVRRCDARGIRVFSDEVYRGLEADPARTLPAAADLSPRALSLNVLSKAYGLPGLRVGWIACRDAELLGRLERLKHYTSICDAGPSDFLAALALRHGEVLKARNRALIAENLPLFDAFFARHRDLFDWAPPQGGCVAFPRFLGAEGVETFCRELVEQAGVLLLPASLFRSDLAPVPADRFRIGVGRRDPAPALAAFEAFLAGRHGRPVPA